MICYLCYEKLLYPADEIEFNQLWKDNVIFNYNKDGQPTWESNENMNKFLGRVVFKSYNNIYICPKLNCSFTICGYCLNKYKYEKSTMNCPKCEENYDVLN